MKIEKKVTINNEVVQHEKTIKIKQGNLAIYSTGWEDTQILYLVLNEEVIQEIKIEATNGNQGNAFIEDIEFKDIKDA
jgi:hypothetical protein